MNITIIGAGNMGGALAKGLASAGENVTVTARTQKTLDHIQAECPALRTSTNTIEAIRPADVIVLAVKPWLIEGVCAEIREHIDIDSVAKQDQNFKSTLIEWCQKHQYKFEFQQKESHEGRYNTPVFHSSVSIEGIPCGTGDGYTKKESDQNAARQALKRIHSDKTLKQGIKAARSREKGKGKSEK